jgi:hypothetical protein
MKVKLRTVLTSRYCFFLTAIRGVELSKMDHQINTGNQVSAAAYVQQLWGCVQCVSETRLLFCSSCCLGSLVVLDRLCVLRAQVLA